MQSISAAPLVILGFDDDARLMDELAQVLEVLEVRVEVVARRAETRVLAAAIGEASLVLVAIAHPESVGGDRTALVEQLLGLRRREQIVMAAPQGTLSGALLDLDRKRGVGLLDLGRRLDPGSEATKRLRKRVAAALIAAQPIDLPTSLFRSAIQQRSTELVGEPLALAASRPLHEWVLVRVGEEGPRASALWSSWLSASRAVDLARLASHLDELRVLELLGRDREVRAEPSASASSSSATRAEDAS